MGKILNFDKFMSEKNKETIFVTVYGETYEVPAQIPAIVPVMMARAESAGDPQMATRMTMKAADVMFGEEVVNEMCDSGMSADNLANLVQELFKMINGVDDEENDSEEVSDEDSRKQTGEGKRAKK